MRVPGQFVASHIARVCTALFPECVKETVFWIEVTSTFSCQGVLLLYNSLVEHGCHRLGMTMDDCCSSLSRLDWARWLLQYEYHFCVAFKNHVINTVFLYF